MIRSKHFLIPAAVICLAVGCTTSEQAPPADSSNLDAWVDTYSPELDRGSELLGAIADAAEAEDLDGLGRACADLGEWASSLAAADPIPLPDIQRLWALALSDAEAASESCVRGVDDLDPNALAESTDHIASFTDHVNDITDRLDPA